MKASLLKPKPKLSGLLAKSKEILFRYRKNAMSRNNKKAKEEIEIIMLCIGKLWGMACDNEKIEKNS